MDAALRRRQLTPRGPMLTRIGPPLAILLLSGPFLFGLFGTLVPAFGYLPAAEFAHRDFTIEVFGEPTPATRQDRAVYDPESRRLRY